MSRFVLRAVASLLLLASAGSFVAASAQRWWPACRRGAFDSEACLRLQVAVVASGSIAVLGVHAWTSGTTGQVAPVTVDPLAWGVWGLALPPLLVVWAWWQRGGWAAAMAAALVASTPVPAYLLGMFALGYTSHDTTPWSDAVVAVPLAAAAVLLWKVEPRAVVRRARLPVPALGLLTQLPVRAQHAHD